MTDDYDQDEDNEDEDESLGVSRSKPMLARGKIMLSPSWVRIFSHRKRSAPPVSVEIITQDNVLMVSQDNVQLVTQ